MARPPAAPRLLRARPPPPPRYPATRRAVRGWVNVCTPALPAVPGSYLLPRSPTPSLLRPGYPHPLPLAFGRGRRLLDGCTAGSPHPWVRRSAPPAHAQRAPRALSWATHDMRTHAHAPVDPGAHRGESAAAAAALWAPNQLQLQLAAKTHATPSPAHGRPHPPRAGSFVLAFGPARGPAGQELQQHPLHAARFALPCTLQLARLRHGTRLSPTRQAATIACLRRHDGLWRVQVGHSGGRQRRAPAGGC